MAAANQPERWINIVRQLGLPQISDPVDKCYRKATIFMEEYHSATGHRGSGLGDMDPLPWCHEGPS